MKKAMTTTLNHLMLSATLLATLAACTKPRPADINDDETKSQIFALSDLQNQQFNIQTGVALQSEAELQTDVHALAQKSFVHIDSSNAPARLQSIFKSLPVSAQAGKAYAIRLSVDSKAVTLLRLVSDVKDLTDLDKGSMIQKTVNKQQINLVPMAQMVIKDYGTLCRVKNDYGENTSNLKICHTDFSQATHVQISLKADDLTAALGQHQMDQVFLKDRLNGRVTTMSALQKQMGFSLYPITDDKVVSYTLPQEGSEVDLMVYKITQKSKITDEKLRQKLDSNIRTGSIAYCPQNILSSLTAEEKKDCVLVLAYTLKGDAVRASTDTTDDLGRPGISVGLTKAPSTASNLVKFESATPVTTVNPTTIIELNPYNTIRVSDILNKEFLMRRTFEDAASTITGFGPGASGYLDLVRFELQDTALVVRRVTVVNGGRAATAIDREEVMSIPVQYKKINPVTANSVAPDLIAATKVDAQYAVLNWADNKISASNSPLSYASDGPELCFSSTSRQEVTDLDNRIDSGILGFSIEGSYSFDSRCSTFVSLNDYWYGGGTQSNFNIKERVSFMVNKGTQDKNPGLNIPFKAQNVLGYGVFTMDQIQPDKFGNGANNVIGTENPMPVIYDFSNGKQLIYHLGGLPEDKGSWVYTALKEGTQEVVADWNQALHRAFVGTSLARDTDYIVLKIDGEDGVTPGHLGDLDRSYIWNFTKNMDSGLLGLSQAAPNPRSGRIEQNNVLMYSGNLLSNIGMVRNSLRKQVQYNNWKQSVFDELVKARNKNSLDNADNANLDTSKTPDNGLGVDDGASDSDGGKTTSQLRKALRLNKSMRLSNSSPNLWQSVRIDKNLQAKKDNYIASQGSDFTMEKIMQQAVRDGLTHDTTAMLAMYDIEALKSNSLSKEQQQNALEEARRLMLTSKFNRNFNKGPNCVMTGEDFATAITADKDILDEDKTPDVFKKWYKATLAHEMGHSLGLTHNFEGSFDKANFLFANEKADKTNRNYSSVMDYIPDEYNNYAGPGPYDVRALRVAYTGMIELSPALKDSISGGALAITDASGNKISVPVTKASDDFYYEISLQDYQKYALDSYYQKQAMPLQGSNWWRLNTADLKRLPVKQYRYCTDKDVGFDPLCNRWDTGTTEKDIVNYYIAQYKNTYAVYNTRGDDLVKMPSKSRYMVGHLLRNFFGIRPFMEETFYRVGLKKDDYTEEQKEAAYQAALTGYEFFIELAGTPTQNLGFADSNRIHLLPHRTDKGNENLLIETKSMDDIRAPGTDFEIDTRGIEKDRMLAMEFLTSGSLGGPRYATYQMGPSFASFEHTFLGRTAKDSLLFNLFTGMFTDNAPSYVPINDGQGFVSLPHPTYESDMSLNLYSRAYLGAVLFLENSSPTDAGNFAAASRVGSGQNAVPKDRLWVAKAGQSATSAASMKFWALDNASVADRVISNAARLVRYRDNSKKIGDDLLKLYMLTQMQKEAADTQANHQKPALTGNLQKDMDNAMADAGATGIEHMAVDTSVQKRDQQMDVVIANLMALNKDRALHSNDEIADVQKFFKDQQKKDVSVEEAEKAIFHDDLIDALEYMQELQVNATRLMDNDQDFIANLDQYRMAGYRAVKEHPLFGVVQDAMANDRSITFDGKLKSSDHAALGSAVAKITYQQNLNSVYEPISRNLEELNSLLFTFHPELNRY